MTDEFTPSAASRTDTEAEASNAHTEPSPDGHASGVPVVIGQAGEVVVVGRPAPGQTVEIQTAAAQTYLLDFPPGEAQVLVDETTGDFILAFDDDGDGTADSRIVFLDMVAVVDAGAAPTFQVGNVQIAGDVLLGQALALAGEDGAPLPDVAAGPAIGGGATQYSDDFGQSIDLLDAEDVIPPTELEFRLIDLENEITLLDEEDGPPLADPVLTPAEQGDLPEGLQDALAVLDGDDPDGEAENRVEIALFKQLDVDGEIGDDDTGTVADFGGADAETGLEDLVFTLLSPPTFGQLILVTAGGDTSFLSPGDTFSSVDTVWWIATADQVDDFLNSNELQFLPDVEFDYSVTDAAGNVATAPVVITIDSEVLPPDVDLAFYGGNDCIEEDSTTSDFNNQVTLDVAAQGDDLLTEIVLEGFQTDWTYDLTGLDTDGLGGGVVVTDNIAGDGTVTISFSPGTNLSYSGSFAVQPPENSDIDHPTITATATVVDSLEPGLSASGEDTFDIPVDAVVDGSEVEQTSLAEGDENTTIDLNLAIDLGGDSTTGFGESQGGTDKDGSESVTRLVVTLTLGTLGWILPASIGEPVESPDGTWTFDTTGADLADVQSLVSSLSVEPPEDFFGDIDVTVTTTTAEAATEEGPNGDSGDECEDDNNVDVDTYEFTVTVNPLAVPVLVVGENVDDDDDNDVTVSHRVDTTSDQDVDGSIVGDDVEDVLIGDVGGSDLVNKTMNLVLVLDTSKSMREEIQFGGESIRRIEALDRAVEQLLDDIIGTAGVTVKLHMISFADDVKKVQTFDIITDGVVDEDALQAAKDFILAAGDNPVTVAQGDTNYEAGFNAALDWFSDDSKTLDNPDFNKTIFISDGAPNRAYSGNTTTVTPIRISNQDALDHVLGVFVGGNPDNFSEFDALRGDFKGVAGTVDAIGINVDDAADDQLDQVDDDGNADNIDDGEELADVLGDLTQVTNLAAVGNDAIVGNGGDDLIFGDSLFTDLLADDESIDLAPGSGWAVMEELVAGGFFDADPSKTEAEEIMDFLRDPGNQTLYDFGRESVTDGGARREGGADVIEGGDGNDTIFGQEGGDTIDGGDGNDVIVGGTGDDSMTGGTGDDTYVWTDQFIAGESDSIAGFESGSDVLDVTALLDGETPGADGSELDDFLEITFDGVNTTIGVDVNGDGSGFTDVTIVVEGVDLTGGSIIQEDIINDLLASGDLAQP